MKNIFKDFVFASLLFFFTAHGQSMIMSIAYSIVVFSLIPFGRDAEEPAHQSESSGHSLTVAEFERKNPEFVASMRKAWPGSFEQKQPVQPVCLEASSLQKGQSPLRGSVPV